MNNEHGTRCCVCRERLCVHREFRFRRSRIWRPHDKQSTGSRLAGEVGYQSPEALELVIRPNLQARHAGGMSTVRLTAFTRLPPLPAPQEI